MIILTPVRWRAGPPRPPELASLALAGAAALEGEDPLRPDSRGGRYVGWEAARGQAVVTLYKKA